MLAAPPEAPDPSNSSQGFIAASLAHFFLHQAEYLNTLGLPEPLVHWGHAGNMAVVLLAMGGYGSYLGWQIRVGDDEVRQQCSSKHEPVGCISVLQPHTTST